MNKISHALTYLRKQKNLTQEELAKALNMNRSSLAGYETGRREPDMDTLQKFANYFNVDVSIFYDGVAEYYIKEKSKVAISTSDPNDIEIITLIKLLPEQDKQMIINMIKTCLDSRGVDYQNICKRNVETILNNLKEDNNLNNYNDFIDYI